MTSPDAKKYEETGVEQAQYLTEETERYSEVPNDCNGHHEALSAWISSTTSCSPYAGRSHPWLNNAFLAINLVLLAYLPEKEMDVHITNEHSVFTVHWEIVDWTYGIAGTNGTSQM